MVVALRKGPSAPLPEYGERIPFLVVFARGSDARLIDQVVSPEEFVTRRLKLNYRYYVEKQIIPVLKRILSLLGVNIDAWWLSFPRYHKPDHISPSDSNTPLLGPLIDRPEEEEGEEDNKEEEEEGFGGKKVRRIVRSIWRINRSERYNQAVQCICASCTNLPLPYPIPCEEHECPVYYLKEHSLDW